MATDTTRRRIHALGIMERVKRLETERKARDAGELRATMAGLQAEKQTLLRRLSGESRIDGVEGAAYLGRFIRSIRAEVERLDSEISALRPELERAEDALRASLSEQKTFEILRLARLAELAASARKREAARLDDIARMRWRS